MLFIIIISWKILPCRLWSLSRQRRPSWPSGAHHNVSIDIRTEISRSYGSGDDGWWCPINHRHGDSHIIGWILSMIRGRNDCRCRSGRRFRRKVTLMMMRSLLLLMMRRMMMRMLLLRLLWVLVIGYCSRKFGWIVSGGARIYWSIVTFIIHLDTKALEFLSISLHCVGLLEARQGCRTAKNIYRILYKSDIIYKIQKFI